MVVDGEPLVIGTAEVIVTQTPRAGWSVAADAGDTVALDLGITPELRREGLAREVIRLVQDARKADGLEVSDRITLCWQAADPELTAALAEHGRSSRARSSPPSSALRRPARARRAWAPSTATRTWA